MSPYLCQTINIAIITSSIKYQHVFKSYKLIGSTSHMDNYEENKQKNSNLATFNFFFNSCSDIDPPLSLSINSLISLATHDYETPNLYQWEYKIWKIFKHYQCQNRFLYNPDEDILRQSLFIDMESQYMLILYCSLIFFFQHFDKSIFFCIC